MAVKTSDLAGTLLPREMMQHMYPVLYQVEQSHWWCLGRRRIIASFVKRICDQIADHRPQVLDVGCGTGANLMRTSTENAINIPFLNGIFGGILGAESAILRFMNLPVGVSGICVARAK